VNFIGTAGWNVPRIAAEQFPATGTHLQRYAQVFNCVEINSSFYRSHSYSTYRRWADSSPSTFRFAVKLPRAITHEAQLRRALAPTQQFLGEVKGLGKQLGPLLIQLPPTMEFDARVASRFFVMIRELYRGALVCEPRHRSWFESKAESVLKKHHIGRVAADPPMAATGDEPGADTQQLTYYRLHGLPRTYWSNYPAEDLARWAKTIQEHCSKMNWVIFDNTAAGCATVNALLLRDLLK